MLKIEKMTFDDFLKEWNSNCPTLTIQTSGSTGKPKKIIVEKARMLASARMTCDTLNLKKGDTALLCMPLEYIAGKMMAIRSIEREMTLISIPPCSNPLRHFIGTTQKIDFAAFVPLQIAKILENEDEKQLLAKIGTVLIGGGTIDKHIEAELKNFPTHIYSTYGMTETLSHIALRRISGESASQWYTPRPQVHVELSKENTLIITAPHLSITLLKTNDIAELNEKGEFRILGRTDNTINTGGIKIQIEDIEHLLHQTGLTDFLITSTLDKTYGETIVLLTISRSTAKIKSAIATLPKYWRPKHIIEIQEIPLTETGKPNRSKAKIIANELIKSLL